jgi:hypothetical protein
MRRSIVSLFFLLLLLLFAAPLTAAAKIVVGLSSVNLAFLPVLVTQEKG